MPNLSVLGYMILDKKIFKDCYSNQSYFEIKILVLSRNSEEDHDRIISVKFHENWTGVFREDV